MDGWVEIFRGPGIAEAEQRALVLAAVGIGCRLVRLERGVAVAVAPAEALAAFAQLAAWERENRAPAEPAAAPVPRGGRAVEAALAYAAVLLFFFAVREHAAFGVDWLAAGAVDGARMLRGEWWRAVTALTLHAEFGHLAGNLAFGMGFAWLVARRVGSGAGWLAIVLAGVSGNALNAAMHGFAHAAIGASTGVFGAVGALCAYADETRPTRWRLGLRRWSAVAAGIMLLAFLGLEGERTDIGAHLSGFACGVVLGFLLGRPAARRWLDSARAQRAAGLLACALPAVAWLAALG